MSRELFDGRFGEWQEAVGGNNSRVVGDAEDGDIIRFLAEFLTEYKRGPHKWWPLRTGQASGSAELAKHYYNIGQKLVSLYLGTCSTCEEKRLQRPSESS